MEVYLFYRKIVFLRNCMHRKMIIETDSKYYKFYFINEIYQENKVSPKQESIAPAHANNHHLSQLKNCKRIMSESYRINHEILESIKITNRIFLPNNRILKKFMLRKLTGNLILNLTIMKLKRFQKAIESAFFFFILSNI